MMKLMGALRGGPWTGRKQERPEEEGGKG